MLDMVKQVSFRFFDKVSLWILRCFFGKAVVIGFRDDKADISICADGVACKILFCGSVGLFETYIAGNWKTKDLERTLDRIFSVYFYKVGYVQPFRYLYQCERVFRPGVEWIMRYFETDIHARSAYNYNEHYDIFHNMLCKNNVYSSVQLNTGDLDADQIAKLLSIVDALQLEQGAKVLITGTGYGALDLQFAKLGISVVSYTNSLQHYDYVCSNIQSLYPGLIDLRLGDCKDLPQSDYGQFDAVVSIEMMEALHPWEYKKYFAVCHRALKDDGLMYIQTITTQYFRVGKNSFFHKYIFPGGWLTKLSVLVVCSEKVGFEVSRIHDLDVRANYVYTLRFWLSNLVHNMPQTLLGDPRELKKWEAYLTTCISAAKAGEFGLHMLLLRKK